MIKFHKDKEDIIDWLDRYKVKNYTLIPDENYGFVVNVSGDVNLNNEQLTFIPVKLNSLEFCPVSVGGSFACNNNELTSLEFCPVSVGGSFLL